MRYRVMAKDVEENLGKLVNLLQEKNMKYLELTEDLT